MKSQKPVEKRVKEMIEIRKKLDEMGLDSENAQVAELFKKMDDFVRGIGFSGHVDMTDFGRVAICKFSLQPHCVSTLVLRQKK
jgi:isopropylmalate/homocitrate/citramalate synthase